MVTKLYTLGKMAYDTFELMWRLLSMPVAEGVAELGKSLNVDLTWLSNLIKSLLDVVPTFADMSLFEMIIGLGVVIVMYVSVVRWAIGMAS